MVETANARYHPGQIVQHRQYHYRGVIFDVDPTCLAELHPYSSALPHPERGQPWYHVLVDGSETITYVAEANLEADLHTGPVDHPLVRVLLGTYQGGRYYRGLDA